MPDPSQTRPAAQSFADPAASAERYRHRWEMPLVTVAALITLGILVGGTVALLTGTEGEAVGETGEGFDVAQYLPLVILAPVIIFVTRFYQIAREKSNAVRVGPDQFPAIWALYTSLAARLGLEAPPRLYIKNGNGVVNAFALSCNRRTKYVVIHAEIALLMDRSPETVEFVLAHELSHHRLHHVSLLRQAITSVPSLIPAFGVSTTRAQEYSADRLAHSVCAHHEETISLLMIGPWLNHEVNHDALRAQTAEERNEWFIRAANIMSNHAVGVKRYDALQRIDREGYTAHGDMF